MAEGISGLQVGATPVAGATDVAPSQTWLAHPGMKTQLPLLAAPSYDGRPERASWGTGDDGSAAELYATDLLRQVALRKER
jgi:hypothetical protein